MELPDSLRQLVSELGDAMNEAFASDPKIRTITTRIHEEGFDLVMALEATLVLRKRGEEGAEAEQALLDIEVEEKDPSWSSEDKAFLKAFKIRFD